MFRQNSPGAHTDTETVIRQALGRRSSRQRGGGGGGRKRRPGELMSGGREGTERVGHGAQWTTQKSERIKI